MINTLKLAAILKKVWHHATKFNSAFLELQIAPGEIFQIDRTMLNQLCEQLKQGIGLTECGRTDLLPYGRSRDARIENGHLYTTIEILKGLKLGGRHSYGSTDDLIKVFNTGLVRDFFIGLGNVLCECNICQKPFSTYADERCVHLPGEKNEDNSFATYKIKEARAMIVSSVGVKVTDHENIEYIRSLVLDKELSDFGMVSAKEAYLKGPRIVTLSSPYRFDW